MKKVSVVFFSGSGHTKLMAEAVHRGAASVPGTPSRTHPDQRLRHHRRPLEERSPVLQKIGASDAVIFGTPTYMGGPAAQFKAFADATGMVWFQQGWRNKLACGFTHSGSPSGDKLSTLQYLADLAFQQGMVWVGLGAIPLDLLRSDRRLQPTRILSRRGRRDSVQPRCSPGRRCRRPSHRRTLRAQRIATLASSYTPPSAQA